MTDLEPDIDSSSEGDGSVSDDSDVLALELDTLITEYFDAQREGRAPSVAEFVAAHPRHEHALRAVLPGASLLDELGKRAEDASPKARSGERLGEYKLLGILGRGGMGVVYEAVQETLGRPVALKVLPASRVVDRKSRERFMREAQAAASLQHPGIVPVYGVGEAEGQVYYAMQRVDGVPLDLLTMVARGESVETESTAQLGRAVSVVSRLRGESGSAVHRDSSTELTYTPATGEIGRAAADSSSSVMNTKPWVFNAVRIAQQIAEALSYAHSRGVLHRDVKPSNVLLDESARAYVTDFGLCKVEDSSSLTAEGDVVGTLRYVPPERFQGRDDARGDVYGVGMILYELLCGRPAFDQKDRATLVQAVTLQAPPRPRKLNPEIPADLERIVLTATAKLPEERYSSAEALISDLGAFQSGRPIRARAPGKLYLAKLFARRNRGLVITAGLSALLLAILGVSYVWNLGVLLGEVEAGRSRAERMFYHAQVHAAVEAARNPNRGSARALRILDSIEPAQRDWLWKTMAARCDVGLLTVDRRAKPIRELVLSSSEDHIAVIRGRSVRIHNARSGATLSEHECEEGQTAAFVPGTTDLLLVDGKELRLRLLPGEGDAASPRAQRLWNELTDFAELGISALDATPRHLALARPDGKVRILAAEDDWAARNFDVPEARKAHLSLFGLDGRAAYAVGRSRLRVLGPEDGRVREVSGATATSIEVLDGAWESPFFVAKSTSSLHAYRYHDKDSDTIDSAMETVRDPQIAAIAIAPDGFTVVAQFKYGKAKIWQQTRGASMVRVAAYLSEPTTMVWPGGGEDILVGGKSGEWRLVPRPSFDAGIPGVSEVRGHYSDVNSLAFDASGDFFAVAEEIGAWSVWSVERHLPQSVNVQRLRHIEDIALASENGHPSRLAVAGEELGVWTLNHEAPTAPAVYEPIESGGESFGVEWRGESFPGELVSAWKSGEVRIARPDGNGGWTSELAWDGGTELTAFDHHRGAGISAVGAADGRVWRLQVDSKTGKVVATPMADLGVRVTSLGIGTLAETVALFTEDERLHLVDMNGSQPALRWSVEGSTSGSEEISSTAVAVDEASGWIASAGADGALQLWSILDGMPGPLLEMRYGSFRGVEFPSPNSAPISVEERGRVTFIETEGVQRMRDLASIEPTNAERLMLMFLAPRVRLAEVEKALARPGTSAKDLRALRRTVKGLTFVGRFHQNVPKDKAETLLLRIDERLEAGDD